MISFKKNDSDNFVYQSTPNIDDIQGFYAEVIMKLELIEKSQRVAAIDAHSAAAMRRHEELAEAVIVAIAFVNHLKSHSS